MTALVLKTLSDLGCRNSRCNEELHFSVDERFFEEENNPRRSSLSQKFLVVLSDKGRLILFLCFFLQMAAKSSSLSHVSFFGVDDENKVDQSLIFFFLPAFLQGRMTS